MQPAHILTKTHHHTPHPLAIAEVALPDTHSPHHLLWEGDCEELLPSLPQQICDAIYLDPPYNTKLQRRYRDTYTTDEWLTLMERVLRHAKRLLKRTGVLFISISDHMLGHLRILGDRVFGSYNYATTYVLPTRGYPGGRFSSSRVEYILLYTRHYTFAPRFTLPRPGAQELVEVAENAIGEAASLEEAEAILRRFTRECTDPQLRWLKEYDHIHHNLPARLVPLTARSATSRYYYTITAPDGRVYPAPKSGWRMKEETARELLEADLLHFGHTVQRWKVIDRSETVAPPALFTPMKSGAKVLSSLCGLSFADAKNPEPLYTLLSACVPAGGVVGDFFAGSGSTMHAVDMLNNDGRGVHSLHIEREHGGIWLARARALGYRETGTEDVRAR